MKKMKSSVFTMWKKLSKPLIIKGKVLDATTVSKAEAKRDRKRNKRLNNAIK